MAKIPTTPKTALQLAVEHSFEMATAEKPKAARKPDLEVTVLPPKTAVERTLAEMSDLYHDKARLHRGQAFVKKAKKSDRRRAIEKQTRKKMRRRK